MARSVVECRDDNDGPVISGYAAVYYDGTPETEFRLGPDMVERISPGAFDRAIGRDDVRALFNHDPSLILGRSPQTLKLTSDSRGLKYEIDANTTRGREVAESIKRGDITGSSFGFVAEEEDVETLDGSRSYIRHLRHVRLFDVSPVTFPAYEGTSSESRSQILARLHPDKVAVDARMEAARILIEKRVSSGSI